jgi:hypothetical protein
MAAGAALNPIGIWPHQPDGSCAWVIQLPGGKFDSPAAGFELLGDCFGLDARDLDLDLNHFVGLPIVRRPEEKYPAVLVKPVVAIVWNGRELVEF